MTETRVVVLGPGEGHLVEMGANPDRIRFKATSDDSDGHLALLEYHAEPASSGVPLHMHDGHEEGFYVLRGSLRMQLGERTLDLQEGGFAFVPRGVAHSFSNPHSQPCVFLGTFSPAGFERFFPERLRVLAETPLDSQALVELARRHGVTYLKAATEAARRA